MKLPTRLITLSASTLFAFTLLFIHWSFAQWTSIGNVDGFEKDPDGLTISSGPAKLQIRVLSPDVIRVRLSNLGQFQPDSSWAVIRRTLGDQSFSVGETMSEIKLSTSRLGVRIEKTPCRMTFIDPDGTIINEDEPSKGICWTPQGEVAVWKRMPGNELYCGFGEKAGSLLKNGKAMSMWNSDIPAYHADADPLYETIPLFYGIRDGRAYGIFLDNTYFSWFNMGKEHPAEYSFGANGGELNYYFFAGPKPIDVVKTFSSLVGTMAIPPRWTLGYQQCRWSYYPEARVREIASTFRSKNIPCDVIYLDIHYMDGYRCFTWDKQRFPDPKRMVGGLAKDGFKMVVIIDPGIKNDSSYWVYKDGIRGDHFVKYPDGKYFVGPVWPGNCVFPDFTRSQTRSWWGSLYQGLIETGIKGFWNDMNEPSVFDVSSKTFDLKVVHDDRGFKTDHRKNHNVYGMQMARGTYEGVTNLRPNERPFVLTRANYAGGHRYAAAWTGDNISSWEHLAMAIPMCLNLSVSGQPFVGSDIGGFIGMPSGELYARWLQLGIFTPLMRSHSEINSPNKEPWEYGKEFEAINKKSIELRYKLLPYIYTQFYKASVDGTPIIRPLFFDYPEDHDMYWREDEFLFGDAFLVAPIVSPGEIEREVRLPEGDWYDYWTGTKYSGKSNMKVGAPIDRIPLFVKAGSMIPTQQIVQYTDQAPVDPLTIEIYPSARGMGTMYEDDGNSFEYRNEHFSFRSFTMTALEKGYQIMLATQKGKYQPPHRGIVLKLNGISVRPTRVVLGRKEIRPSQSEDIAQDRIGWKYDLTAEILRIKFDDTLDEQLIEITK